METDKLSKVETPDGDVYIGGILAKKKAKRYLSPKFLAAGRANFSKGRLASLKNTAKALSSEQWNIAPDLRKQLIDHYVLFFSTLEESIEAQRRYDYFMAETTTKREKEKALNKIKKEGGLTTI